MSDYRDRWGMSPNVLPKSATDGRPEDALGYLLIVTLAVGVALIAWAIWT